jgi:uncharacterized lipoprotein YddW (UPF0748 family)
MAEQRQTIRKSGKAISTTESVLVQHPLGMDHRDTEVTETEAGEFAICDSRVAIVEPSALKSNGYRASGTGSLDRLNDVSAFNRKSKIASRKIPRPPSVSVTSVSLWSIPFAIACAVICSTAAAQTPEVRGTWISTTGYSTGIVNSSSATNTNITRLRNIGLNSVYMDAWRNGATYFNSPTMQAITGQSRATEIGTRDLMSEALIAGHRNRMTVIPWFQYGLMAQFGDAQTAPNTLGAYMRNRDWLLRNQSGTFTDAGQGFSYMNPLVPEVRNLVKGIAVDVVRNYDVDGIQFDDHLAWPVNYGYDNLTRDTYLAETGRSLPATPTGNSVEALQFKAWRASKITSLVTEIQDAVRAVRPDAIVSISPSVAPFAYDNFCVDWPAWRAAGLLDEYVPQVYRSSFNSFDTTWDGSGSQTTGGQVQYMGNRRGDFAGGIAFVANSTTVPIAQVQQAINLTRSSNVGGHVLWFANDVLLTAGNEASMTTFYNGTADRPDRAGSYRLAPVSMTRNAAAGTYSGTTPELARYRIITRTGTQWTERFGTVLPLGSVALTMPQYDQVELLIDRRGFINGDANFDGVVDMTDLFAVTGNFNTTGKLWTEGDFTLDGRVDVNDLSFLAAHWGSGASGAIEPFPLMHLIPEPGAMMAAGAVALATLRRRRV